MKQIIKPFEWWENLSDFWKEIFRYEVLYYIKFPDEFDENYVPEMEKIIMSLWEKKSLDLSFDTGKYNRRRITSLKALQPFVHLNHLNLNGNSIQSNGFKFIYHLNHLTKLELMDNQLSDIQPLAHFVNLEILELGNNEIEDISVLSHLTHLKSLGLSNNRIVSLKPLENLVKLENLFIFTNKVRKLDGLSNLVNLKVLTLGKNEIYDIKQISKLSNLIKLALGANYFLRDITPLKNLKKLEKLGLNDCIRIDEIQILHHLSSLKWVSLYKVPCKKSELDELQEQLPLCHFELNRNMQKTDIENSTLF